MPRLFLICFCLGLVTDLRAQTIDSEWSAFTSMSQIEDLLADGFDVWCATRGGVLHYHRLLRTYRRFTGLDGLAGNRLLSLTADDEGNLWFGSDGDGLSRFRPATSTFDPPYLEFRDLAITSLLSQGNVLYVGTNRGVSVFLVDKEEVKETYHLMANLPKDTAAQAMSILDGTLFIGTDDGVAWARLDQQNLQDPDSWLSLRLIGPVRDAIATGGLYHVASRLGVFTYDPETDRFYVDLRVDVTSLGALGEQVVAATADGRLLIRTDVETWRLVPSPAILNASAMSRSGSSLWLGTDAGLRVVGQPAPPPSGEPGSSRFYEIALAGEDDLWVASVPDDQQRSLSAGVYHLSDSTWSVYDRSTGMPNDELVALETDGEGRLWIGSWGGSVIIREADDTWTRIPPDDTALQGIAGAPSFVVISDIQRDPADNMWMLNVLVGVAVLDGYPPEQQFLFDQVSLGLSSDVDFYRMDIGPDGLKWIASRTDGLIMLDDGGTPFTGGDDRMILVDQTVESRLTSNRISDVLVDSDGKVWMASDNGINVLTPDYDRATGTLRHAGWRTYGSFDGLPSTVISTFEEDDAGNIWVGTDEGLSRIGQSGEVDFTFTQGNSGLIDSRVKGLRYDSDRGEMWIGTFDGLNRLRVTTPSNGGLPQELTVFPNPFATAGRQELTFAGLPLGAPLRIYSVAGELVTSVQGKPGRGTVTWRGQNDAGFLVASGIYYYVAEGETGDTVTGRFAIVNGVRR